MSINISCAENICTERAGRRRDPFFGGRGHVPPCCYRKSRRHPRKTVRIAHCQLVRTCHPSPASTAGYCYWEQVNRNNVFLNRCHFRCSSIWYGENVSLAASTHVTTAMKSRAYVVCFRLHTRCPEDTNWCAGATALLGVPWWECVVRTLDLYSGA